MEFVANQRGETRCRNPAPRRVQEPALKRSLGSSSTIFNNPPTSHFVDMVDSIHHILEEHESDEGEDSSSCPNAIPAAVHMVNTENRGGDASADHASNADFDTEAAATELAVMCTPVQGTDDSSKALEAQCKKMQQSHIRQQREWDLLVERQAQLLASMKHVLNWRVHCVSSANATELANRGRMARDSMLGAAGDGSPAFRTPARNLMAATEEIKDIKLPADHPAVERLAVTKNLLKTTMVQRAAYTESRNKIATTSDMQRTMGSSWSSRTPDRSSSWAIVPFGPAPPPRNETEM